MTDVNGATLTGQALVYDQAASRLDPSGFDPSRGDKQLSALLARYMDLPAFTAKHIGKERAEKMKARREIATSRARAAIRFFMKPENLARLTAQAIEARRAETGTGSVHESAVGDSRGAQGGTP